MFDCFKNRFAGLQKILYYWIEMNSSAFSSFFLEYFCRKFPKIEPLTWWNAGGGLDALAELDWRCLGVQVDGVGLLQQSYLDLNWHFLLFSGYFS